MLACAEDACLDPCQHDRAVAAATPEEAAAIIRSIQDPIIRDAAVLDWETAHRGVGTPQAIQALCALTTEGENAYCRRRAGAAHLAR